MESKPKEGHVGPETGHGIASQERMTELRVQVPMHFLAYLAFEQLHFGRSEGEIVRKALVEHFSRSDMGGFRSWDASGA